MTKEQPTGFCPICGKTGIPGEECLDCREVMVAIDADLDRFDNPEQMATYPKEIISKQTTEDDLLEE